MSPRPYDLPSLVAGIAVALFGLLLLVDAAGVAELGFAILAPSFLAVCGSILVATGLSAGDDRRRSARPPTRDLREDHHIA
jgi:hypothetical protein